LKVQRLIDDPDCSIDSLAKLVQADPVLAARVVAVANSVVYNRTGRGVADIRSAVSRLGLNTLRVLAASVVVKQMEGMAGTPAHRKLAVASLGAYGPCRRAGAGDRASGHPCQSRHGILSPASSTRSAAST
jgi:hypothetical protein